LTAVRAACAAGLALVLVYLEALAGYLRDQHYQEHFLYLWVFLGLALTRTLRGPFRDRFTFTARRDRIGLLLVGVALLLLAASEAVGSSTGTRTSLAVLVTGFAAIVVPAWPLSRCLAHGALLLLCFGVPYTVWFPLTSQLTWGVAAVVALPARLGLASYAVDGSTVRFPHYDLAITPDCSGLGQLLTFVGIAALAVLSSGRNPRRVVALVVLAVVLSWLSNLARVGTFVGFVALGWTGAVDDPTWHALLGFVVFLPFVTALVWWALRTHAPLPRTAEPAATPGRWPVGILVVTLLAVHVASARGPEPAVPEPAWFSQLAAPPGHRLLARAASEASDMIAYETPWLWNARYQDEAGNQFDLFHYVTGSRSHLCVHKVAACIPAEGRRIRYGEPRTVDGQTWWPIAYDAPRADESIHVYFAFEVGKERRDDSWATLLAVFGQRLLGKTWEVRLTRVTFPGPLPPQPSTHAAKVLGWLGKLTNSSS
jgi:exosortase/archaeosortase family protein